MKRREVFLALLLLFLLPGLARAGGPPTLDEYRGDIAQAAGLIVQAQPLPAGPDRQARIDRARAILQGVDEIRLPDGARVRVDNSGLIQSLGGTAPDLAAVHARLAALSESLALPPTAPPPQARAQLHDLLGRPPFSTGSSLLDQILQAVQDLLDRFFSAYLPDRVFDLRDPIAVAGFAVLAAVALYLLLRLRRNVVAEARLDESAASAGRLTSAEAIRRASQLAQAGDFRSGVRELFMAALLLLDERGRLLLDEGRTNREYLKAASREPDLYGALGPIVDTFERTWYGMERISGEEYESYRRRVEALVGTT
jgi:hypothetical protein